MKHNLKITIILLTMFVVTQFIGLYMVDFYSPVEIVDGVVQNVTNPSILPFGMAPPEIKEEIEFYQILPQLIIAFAIAIGVLVLLSKLNAAFFLKLWFFVVVILALGISFNAILIDLTNLEITALIALAIALPLAFVKIYKQNFLIHNTTELFIYPGIAAVFVPILNIWTIIILLIVISLYDMWAVWHSGFMQRLAKFQIDQLKIFSGFFVPYAGSKVKAQVAKLKKSNPKALKTKKFRVNIAILGGGDVVFPIITAGVVMKTVGLGLASAFFVIAGATFGLAYLFFLAKKKKFYPAMPFITAGIFAGMILSWLVF
jgi:presenilin-like A22 family membrane protease